MPLLLFTYGFYTYFHCYHAPKMLTSYIFMTEIENIYDMC